MDFPDTVWREKEQWKSRALAAEAERDALKAEVERLRGALKQARDWLMEVYSDLFEKRDLEGAARNYDRAHFCENHRNPKKGGQ